MSPFDQYDTVDIYLVDEDSVGRSYMFKQAAEILFGSAASRLDAALFPDDVPTNRSCHIVIVDSGDELNGKHKTLNSSSFFMIRIPNDGALPYDKSASLSPLVIGLISAGCGALLIAIVAIFLLVRARRRYKGNTSYFKSLDDQPGSPTEESAKGSSNFKLEDDQESATAAARTEGYGDALFAGSIAAGRSSSNTARSAEPMIKGAPTMLPYHSQSPPSPAAPLPLLERKTSTLYNVPESAESAAAAAAAAGAGTATVGTTGRQNSMEKNPVLSTNDAQLIAETFRKSMRKPQWENKHDDDDDDDDNETDEARRAANALLRKELSEEGVDVQRGVQRRVTIQDRAIRTPGGSTLASHSLAIPPP
ncbi:hypothetical protein BG015_002432 [Linnemannia schmuckeri]|uniref:Uncharacterized protein n=1 Tax=Linnemannia schmuckeri TaxID=64567 RepID=A0A9P5RS02_9FUNG|nr:hypothetical protein BG015_002432 [Linnemannia schmuckeri]